MSLYVYGVVAAGRSPDLDVEGVGGDGRVTAIDHDGVSALVSELGDGGLEAARDLRAHWRVLDEAAQRSTVIPVRFGTVVEDEQALVQDFLSPEGQRLTLLLRELDGKVQLSVKAFYDEEKLLAEVVAGSREVARMRERVAGLPEAASYYERIRLGELVAAEIDARRARDADLVLGRLEPLAVAVHQEEASTTDTAVSAAFLVERERIDEFNEAVGRLTEEVGDRLRLRYVGPMPPYGFADVELTQGGATWA